MTYETILYDVTSEIATVTLNRPSKLNAYTVRMGNELMDALTAADEDPGVRVVILTGAGKAFCAGADIGSFAEDIDTRAAGGTGQHTNQRIKYYPHLMNRFSKPTIAAINGYALGIGFTLTLGWDMRIIAEGTRVGLTFPRVGLMMELGSTYLLPRLIGVSNAAEMMLTGRQFTAEECYQKGLVSYVVPGDKLMEKAQEIANEILLCSPTSLNFTRRALHDGLRGSLDNACSFEAMGIERCYLSPEHKEYVASFMEKRAPDFRQIK